MRLTEQCGHTKPLMFSTIPSKGSLVFKQKVTSRLTSARATPCGRGRRRFINCSWYGMLKQTFTVVLKFKRMSTADLRCGNEDGAIRVEGPQSLHHTDVLITGPRRRVH